MHQSHEQIELRLFPKVLPLVGVGGILDDDLRDGLHQVFVLLNPAQAVPGITVFHVQKVEHPDLITLFPEKRGHTLVDLSLRIYTDQALLRAPFSSALKNKGLHKATGLARAGGPHEGQLLPGLGVEDDVVGDGLALLVLEVHVEEPHVAGEPGVDHPVGSLAEVSLYFPGDGEKLGDLLLGQVTGHQVPQSSGP